MPRKSKDRPGRDDSGGPAAVRGDEDYDWIRYLGEGRGAGPGRGGSGAAAAPPVSAVVSPPARRAPQASLRPDPAGPAGRGDRARRREREVGQPREREAGGRREREAGGRREREAGGRREREAGGRRERAGQDRRGAGGSDAAAVTPEYDGRSVRQVPAAQVPPGPAAARRAEAGQVAGRTAPGRAVRVTQGRAVDLVSGDAIAGRDTGLLFNPAADDYRQPLYLDPGPRAGASVPAGSARALPAERDWSRRPSAEPGWSGPAPADDWDPRLPAEPGWSGPAFPKPGRTRPAPAKDDWGRQAPAEPGWSGRAPGDSEWPAGGGSDTGLDTAEYASPLYPALADGRAAPVVPRGPLPGEDPLADTDPRRRPGPAGPPPGRANGRRTGSRLAAPRRGRPGPAGADDDTGGVRRSAGLGGGPGLAGAGAAGAATRAFAGLGQDAATAGAAAVAAGEDTDADWLVPPPGTVKPAQARPAPKPGKPGKAAKTRKRKTPGARPGTARKPGAAAKKRLRRGRAGRRLLAVTAALAVLAAGIAAYLALRPGAKHMISTPARLGGYSRQQANATADRLKQRIETAARGAVKNVVAAVYQRSTGPGTSREPQVVVFIGGNLAGGTSATSLISAYMARLSGAFTTSPGKLGGQAACAPGSASGPAECAWADDDTFGVVVSATMSSKALAGEMRMLRPQVEHVTR